MKDYNFRIVWENSYAPSSLLNEFSNAYAKLSSYNIKVMDTSAKSAMAKATEFIKFRTNNEQAFTLIPRKE